MTHFVKLFNLKQDKDNAAMSKTSIESYHDLRDVRELGSKGNMDDGMNEISNRVPHDSLGLDYICIDLLDRKICISCNEGGEVLVCGERGCPVTLHAKCISREPKFDDMGNFYCPYCWYKGAVAEVRELRKMALIAKKDLSNFLDKNVITSDKLSQKDGKAKRKELKELTLVGNSSCLDHGNRQGSDSVHSQPLQIEGDQQNEIKRVTVSADQHGIAVEGEAHTNALAETTDDSRHYREEKAPVHIDLVHKSMNREKFDVHNISETRGLRFVEGVELADSRCNDENVHERIVDDGEEAEPFGSFHLGKYTDGDSPDIAFDKGAQESVTVSIDSKGTMKDKEKSLQNELKVPATYSSVSETTDSDSEAFSVKESCVKQRTRKTAYPQMASSVRKAIPPKSNFEVENTRYKNEKITTSKTLRRPKGYSKQGKKLTLSTGMRKRLKWTAEEENMLKEGVLRFSMENQKIPWRKILEYGCHVFDNTRTPVDLKDKWRNIIANEGLM